MSMRRLVLLATAIALLGGPFAPIAAAADPSLEQVPIESASTPAQHTALANYYASKATAARKEAEHHRAMGKAYGGVKASQAAMMRSHCDKLATLYDDEAKQFDMLASMDRDMAK
jgi:hypothetical protein